MPSNHTQFSDSFHLISFCCLKVLWNVVQEISKDESTSGDQSTATFHKSYAILCGLADFFLSSSAEHNICRHVEFWEIIQKGVILMEPLTLKRAIFLLKKAVNSVKQQSQKMDVRDNGRDPIFRWDPGHEEEFLQVWQEYVLMIEILDEGQVSGNSFIQFNIIHVDYTA